MRAQWEKTWSWGGRAGRERMIRRHKLMLVHVQRIEFVRENIPMRVKSGRQDFSPSLTLSVRERIRELPSFW